MANLKSAPATKSTINSDVSWTFFTNHTHVLVYLTNYGDAPLKDVAASIGITERAVQNIVAELEEAGVLIKRRVGRQNSYQLNKDFNLRHPLEKHCTIGEVLSLIHGSAKRKRAGK